MIGILANGHQKLEGLLTMQSQQSESSQSTAVTHFPSLDGVDVNGTEAWRTSSVPDRITNCPSGNEKSLLQKIQQATGRFSKSDFLSTRLSQHRRSTPSTPSGSSINTKNDSVALTLVGQESDEYGIHTDINSQTSSPIESSFTGNGALYSPRGQRSTKISKKHDRKRPAREKSLSDGAEPDRRCSKLQQRLAEEIDRNGFLPASSLIEILSPEAVQRELGKHHSLFKLHPHKLTDLNFNFPKGRAKRRDAQKEKARIIYGDNQSPPSILDKAKGNIFRASNNDAPKKSYLKVLAILILIERPARIKSFIDKEVCDDDLPLLMKLPRGNIGPCQFYSRLEGERDGPLECFDKWSGQEKKAFEDHQWRVVARIFKRGEKKLVDHLKFLPHDILPFTFHGKEKRIGGFGHVNKVSIHPSHHNFEACGKFFAVKTLRPHNMISTGNLFRREVAILRRISHDTHTHLISLLATYEHHDCYHLIFSWAEHDLEEYWKRHRSEGKQTLMWLAEQCHGIVGGLEFIQYFPTQSGWSLLQQDPDPETVQRRIQSRGAVTSSGNVIRHLYGRHGDIKPRNILWFADTSRSSPIYGRPRGTLKITDFGFADFSKNCEVDRQSLVYGIVHTHTYRAPEVDFVEELLSPLTDIWSLGCVFLEFITWFFEGWKLIEEFSRKRLDSERTGMTGKCENTASDTFFFTREDKMSKKLVPETKKAVSIHINELKERAKVGGFARDFLVMIENDMLVPQRVGGEGHACRKSAKLLRRTLERLRREQGWMNQFNSDTDNDD